MSFLGCAGEDAPGANYTPPTLGEFMKKQALENRRLREAKAGQQVIREAKMFHERQARRHGINTNRGLAHFRASRMFTREGNRLQEMFDQGGQDHSELPPKSVMKASKDAMMFHKKQAEKAGLDSDLGHAHVAAMERHADIHKKAKQQHLASRQQQQPMQASAEGGPGSGPHGSGSQPVHKKGLGAAPMPGDKISPKHLQELSGNRAVYAHSDGNRYEVKKTRDGWRATGDYEQGGKREALPGHGSKQSPVPVPKKSEQPSEDIHDPNKPPVSLNPADANKPMRRLQQNESAEGGPGSGRRKSSDLSRKGEEPREFKRGDLVAHSNGRTGEVKGMKGSHVRVVDDNGKSQLWHPKNIEKVDTEHWEESRESKIRNFGRRREARGPDDGMKRTHPRGAGTLMDDDQKEARRSLRRPIWETDDSERDRSESGLTA